MSGNGSVLVINPGSSNVKFGLYSDGKEVINDVVGINNSVETILNKIKGYKIEKVMYRVVYSGEYKNHIVITPSVISNLKKNSGLDPTHMPSTIKIIESFMKKIKAKHIACFDSVFHKTLPEVARIYAIPSKLTKKYNIYRYGFHGLAHEYMAGKAKFSNVITCQLGNGISVTAVKNGKSIDTSMGFTPLEGLPMGTRSGNIDPTIVSYLAEKENKSAKQIIEILNTKSGMKGIAGENDVKKLLNRKDSKAKLAVDILIYNIRKYIGAYSSVLGKVDCIVFGGGISKNTPIINKIMHGINARHIIVDVDEQKIMFDISKSF